MDYKVFGCKTNRYFAEKWLLHPHLSDKKGYFIASCVVTDRAKAKWAKYALKKLPTLNHDEKLYLSGCGNIRDGMIDPKFFEVYPEFVPWRERIEILPEDPEDFALTDTERKHIRETKIRSFKNLAQKTIFTRKFIVVQTGCDNFCTFCLTLQARGRHKWREKEEILREIKDFVNFGGKEVVLTGINLGAWGAPTSNNYSESRLVELVYAILEQTNLERLRISSLGVEFCSDELISLFAHKRINAYAHLSIQSASSRILEHMNRHYDGEKVEQVLTSLRTLVREDGVRLNIGADMIVGFPSETEREYETAKHLVESLDIATLHAFPFSAHVDHYGVPAGGFPDQIPNHIIERRIKDVLSCGEEVFMRFARSCIGKEFRVLLEKVSATGFSGWTENYLFASQKNFSLFPGQKIARGEVVRGVYTDVIKHKEG